MTETRIARIAAAGDVPLHDRSRERSGAPGTGQLAGAGRRSCRRGPRRGGAGVRVAGGHDRQTCRLPDLRAQSRRGPAGRHRHPAEPRRPGDDEGRQRRVGDHRWTAAAGFVPLQLQRERRVGDRPAQPGDQRVEQQRLEPRARPRCRVHGYQRRAARRGGCRHLLLDGAAEGSSACTSTRRRGTNWATASSPSSICSTAPATPTTPGPRSAAPGFILDNLIAAKKATPMIVVMPAGHTTQTTGGRAPAARR